MHCIYLHGFASGPSSTKAAFFFEQLKQLELTVEVPDLNVPDFESLTISSQLQLVERLLQAQAHQDVILIGSSMGGLLATLAAKPHRTNVRGLILLAPGFGLSRRWQSLWGPDAMERWQRDGYLEVFHHAKKGPARLWYEFVTDAASYQSEHIQISCPTLVLHGQHDDVVPIGESIQFVQTNRELAALHVLDDGHQLINSLPLLWNHSKQFINKLSQHHQGAQ